MHNSMKAGSRTLHIQKEVKHYNRKLCTSVGSPARTSIIILPALSCLLKAKTNVSSSPLSVLWSSLELIGNE